MAVHVVKPGDSLTKIARRFGSSVEAIKKANPYIEGLGDIFTGLMLCVPGSSGASMPRMQVYEVQRGDNLTAIASRFGSSVEAIKKANGIEDANVIQPGLELCVPGVQLVIPAYEVQRGDNLTAIASRFGSSVEAIDEFNPIITDPDDIQQGWVLLVPRVRRVVIRGPFWSADAELVRLGDPRENWAYRSLFLDNTLRKVGVVENLLLPGTLLALCRIRRLRVSPAGDSGPTYRWETIPEARPPVRFTPQEIEDRLQSGKLSLLLVQADPEEWQAPAGTRLPELNVLSGEINLDAMNPEENARERLYEALTLNPADLGERAGAARLPGALSAHGSGLSIYGQFALPWQSPRSSPVSAPFQLARLLPDPPAPQPEERRPGFRLTIEAERLTEAEKTALVSAWGNLSRYVNPKHPLNELGETVPEAPGWVTFEIADPLRLPRLYWHIASWQEHPASLPLHLGPDDVNLLLSDQQPYDTDNPPTSLARAAFMFTYEVRAGDTLTAIARRFGSSVEAIKMANDIQDPDNIFAGQRLLIPRGEEDHVVVTRDGDELLITVSIGPDASPAGGWLDYTASPDADGAWQEKWVLADAEVAFSAPETARFLRDAQDLPVPEWTGSPGEEPIEPPVLWAFMPLADGWAQLPVPNLTEQIYLDADLVRPTATAPGVLLQGAVSFGNHGDAAFAYEVRPGDTLSAIARRLGRTEQAILEANDIQDPDGIPPGQRLLIPRTHRDEQPWDLTLTNVGSLRGRWSLALGADASPTRLADVSLRIRAPELTVNGLLWLSTERPTEEDALPGLDDWVGGLRTIPLKTTRPGSDPFPAVVTTPIQSLEFRARPLPGATNPLSALLGAWSFIYRADADVLKEMVQKRVLPPDVFARQPPDEGSSDRTPLLPLAWLRHPTLPTIQALPLTQSKLPPNHPSGSRQLAPFELPVAEEDGDRAISLPKNWRFGISGENGAAYWPVLQSRNDCSPARAWRLQADLPLAALSLPGLVLDPNITPEATGLSQDTATFLPLQYRFDLPYADEINALAQLPKVPQGLERVSPVADALAESVPPLTRESFEEHWRRLSERASLAAADAVDAFFAATGNPVVRHLIEAFDWPVEPKFELDQYPGKLILPNANGGQSLPIAPGGDALQGVTGNFVEDGDGRIKRLEEPPGSQPYYAVKAGSMAARREADGAYRDQRGLRRSATSEPGSLLKTPVRLHESNVTYELTSALTPCPLRIGSDVLPDRERTWRFWFRDLPVQEGVFDGTQVRSDEAQDVNDPEAASRERNYLSGYEWRLELDEEGFVSLFGLHFYPLRLERVAVGDDRVERVEIVGRLQLPLHPSEELEEIANAVRVTFEREDGAEGLTLTGAALASEVGEWPLAMHGAELADAPRLLLKKIALGSERDRIEIDDAELGFFLFDTEWTIPLDKLTFEGQSKIEQTYAVQPADVIDPFTPTQLALLIDLDSEPAHEVSLLFAVRLANTIQPALTGPRPLRWQRLEEPATPPPRATASDERSKFSADVRFHLLGARAGEVVCEAASLFDDMELPCDEEAGTQETLEVSYTRNALQFAWQRYRVKDQAATDDAKLQLLPGMHISSSGLDSRGQDAPGFAALSFSVLAADGDAGVPALRLETSFVEAMLFCRWGDSLQGGHVTAERTSSAVFASSAGDLVFGYTARWQATGWEETLLLNGFLEVKNLISWPLQVTYDETNTTITLPAARIAGRPLDHTRHTMRVLFNQHQVTSEILVLGKGELIFDLARDRSWQFLAVVEHQLVDVLPSDGSNTITLQHDRRWTVAQEVRLFAPANFKRFLDAQQTGRVRTADPEEGTDPIGDALHGYLGTGLRSLLTGGTSPELDRLPAGTLLVEASALHWVKQVVYAPSQSTLEVLPQGSRLAPNPTTLQYLPQGSQLAMLSAPQDYGPTDPHDPRWLLLTTPFLGRLHDRAHDGLDPQAPPSGDPSPLQVDPVLHLQRKLGTAPSAPLPKLALAFGTWGDTAPVTIDVSGFDAAIGRTWARLDPLSLEENWFRSQHPMPEEQPARLQSVLASLPPTPARLSRPTALRRAWDASIRSYPPATTTAGGASEPSGREPVWRENSLLAPQGVSGRDSGLVAPYGWHMSALQILSSDLGRKDPDEAEVLRTYVAATVLPTSPPQDDLPLGYAVSPYLGLEMRAAVGDAEVRVVFAELLCVDAATGDLRPVATHVWERQDTTVQEIRDASMAWARESHSRLCPESPIALLRYREINEHAVAANATRVLLSTGYAFAIVSELRQPEKLARRTFRLRSTVTQLRFREGQFGGGRLPEHVRPFELAPPQTTALEPLYLTERPQATTPGEWPWGMSAMRVGVQYTKGKVAVIGHLGNGSANGSQAASLTLWWQALQHTVQYRAAIRSGGRPTAGLPPNFRAAAIKSMLPVLPEPSLPAKDPALVVGDPIRRWQPVLPGALRYVLPGARSGIMLAMRHALLRQSFLSSEDGTARAGRVMVSGSIPVQNRVPRPVPLPANRPGARGTALQTWGSYFDEPDLNRNLLVTASPADEAFVAACGDDPARSLRMRLERPLHGAITPQWDGTLRFGIEQFEDGTPGPSNWDPSDWDIAIELVDEDRLFEFERDAHASAPALPPYRFRLRAEDGPALKEHLTSKVAGGTLLVRARVEPAGDPAATGDGCFRQTLTFELRVRDDAGPTLPLEPRFAHFEDPEYNRRLASSSARASRVVKLTKDTQTAMHTVTLAADRREYNPDGRVALRHDWDTEPAEVPENVTANLRLKSIDANGVPRDLQPTSQDECAQIEPFTPGKLVQLSLTDLQHGDESQLLQPGETLQLELTIEQQDEELVSVFLPLKIVATPVTPVSDAGYALLRERGHQGRQDVECVRFAWGPMPARVELVCPADLKTEVVRRRAVFHWSDSGRPGGSARYALQKLARTGATHVPEFVSPEPNGP